MARESWGAKLYGDPCRQCGFDWTITVAEAVDRVRQVPDVYARAAEGCSGLESDGVRTWTVAGDIAHVADNLRIWAERLESVRLSGHAVVAGYDQDALAHVRGYATMRLEGALWSLRSSAGVWAEAVDVGLQAGVVLDHAARGPQRAEDVARNNAHDALHHLWDVRSIVGEAAGSA